MAVTIFCCIVVIAIWCGVAVVVGVPVVGAGISGALSVGTLSTTSIAGTGVMSATPPAISAVVAGWVTTMGGLCDPSFKWLGAMRDMFFVVGGA